MVTVITSPNNGCRDDVDIGDSDLTVSRGGGFGTALRVVVGLCEVGGRLCELDGFPAADCASAFRSLPASEAAVEDACAPLADFAGTPRWRGAEAWGDVVEDCSIRRALSNTDKFPRGLAAAAPFEVTDLDLSLAPLIGEPWLGLDTDRRFARKLYGPDAATGLAAWPATFVVRGSRDWFAAVFASPGFRKG